MPLLLADPAGGVPAAGSRRLLRRRLMGWYRRVARPLPWRGAGDPYRVWVSETMLQQTQVATAIPFYQRFIGRFPDILTLARSREDQVLAEWAGLGYYRRARSLRAAAREVAERHGGRIPSDPAAFAALPGVGRYTAGAVLSIAFGRRLAAVDGNAARVLSRLHAEPLALRDGRGARRLWTLAEALVPMRRPGDWNQALMELGARICIPRGPRCEECPVRALCAGRALGRLEDLPPAPIRPPTLKVRRAVAALRRGRALLVVRRRGALLDGLWEPPGVELEGGGSPGAALAAELARLGIAARLVATGRRVRHRITRREIEVEVWAAAAGPIAAPAGARWVDPAHPRVALTALARKVAAALGEAAPPAGALPRGRAAADRRRRGSAAAGSRARREGAAARGSRPAVRARRERAAARGSRRAVRARGEGAAARGSRRAVRARRERAAARGSRRAVRVR